MSVELNTRCHTAYEVGVRLSQFRALYDFAAGGTYPGPVTAANVADVGFSVSRLRSAVERLLGAHDVDNETSLKATKLVDRIDALWQRLADDLPVDGSPLERLESELFDNVGAITTLIAWVVDPSDTEETTEFLWFRVGEEIGDPDMLTEPCPQLPPDNLTAPVARSLLPPLPPSHPPARSIRSNRVADLLRLLKINEVDLLSDTGPEDRSECQITYGHFANDRWCRIEQGLKQLTPESSEAEAEKASVDSPKWRNFLHDEAPKEDRWHGSVRGTIKVLCNWLNITQPTFRTRVEKGHLWVVQHGGQDYEVFFPSESAYRKAKGQMLADKSDLKA